MNKSNLQLNKNDDMWYLLEKFQKCSIYKKPDNNSGFEEFNFDYSSKGNRIKDCKTGLKTIRQDNDIKLIGGHLYIYSLWKKLNFSVAIWNYRCLNYLRRRNWW